MLQQVFIHLKCQVHHLDSVPIKYSNAYSFMKTEKSVKYLGGSQLKRVLNDQFNFSKVPLHSRRLLGSA